MKAHRFKDKCFKQCFLLTFSKGLPASSAYYTPGVVPQKSTLIFLSISFHDSSLLWLSCRFKSTGKEKRSEKNLWHIIVKFNSPPSKEKVSESVSEASMCWHTMFECFVCCNVLTFYKHEGSFSFYISYLISTKLLMASQHVGGSNRLLKTLYIHLDDCSDPLPPDESSCFCKLSLKKLGLLSEPSVPNSFAHGESFGCKLIISWCVR